MRLKVDPYICKLNDAQKQRVTKATELFLACLIKAASGIENIVEANERDLLEERGIRVFVDDEKLGSGEECPLDNMDFRDWTLVLEDGGPVE